jgi:hypothetical protein
MTPKEEEKHPTVVLSIKDQRGYWLGNTWVPPKGWKLYSPEEMRFIYANKTILWTGDSSARRTALTMYELLNSAKSSNTDAIPTNVLDNVLDTTKRLPCIKYNDAPWQPYICREMPDGPTSDFMIYRLNCFKQLEDFCSSELSGESNITANVDLVVVSSPGLWEINQPNHCRPGGGDIIEAATKALAKLAELSRARDDLTIVWRTSQFDTSLAHKNVYLNLNAAILNQMEQYQSPSFMVMDYAGTMLPRSHGVTRIHGDSPEHLGLDARLISLQMLNNLVVNHQDNSLFTAY